MCLPPSLEYYGVAAAQAASCVNLNVVLRHSERKKLVYAFFQIFFSFFVFYSVEDYLLKRLLILQCKTLAESDWWINISPPGILQNRCYFFFWESGGPGGSDMDYKDYFTKNYKNNSSLSFGISGNRGSLLELNVISSH
jgi:hypothetical protein